MEQTHRGNYRKFLLLWAGELISSIGGGLTSFGLGVYVFNQTGSAASMALVTLLAFLPTLLLSAPAGVLADRYDRRLMMMLGDGLSGLGLVYILICMLTGGAQLYQICIGVTISSIFSSLLEPAYRATVTDILSKEQYTKASGMVSLTGSVRYLLSPVIAGVLLAVSDIKLLLIIDICTFILTVITTGIVKRGLETKPISREQSFTESFREGWHAVTEKKGIITLIVISSIITCFMGVLQTLAQPTILAFSDSTTLGVSETVCACGMLVSSIFLGICGIKERHVLILCAALSISGLGMIGFGWKENIVIICAFGFLFFASLPFANSCLDYLVRSNIADEKQGRAWGLIGLISQLGYVVAYSLSGIAADEIGNVMNIGVGRGSAIVISISGVLMIITAILLYRFRSVRNLQKHS